MISWQAEFGNAFSGQRVLVTGATGFIGRHLCGVLVGLGAEVHGVSRSSFAWHTAKGIKLWQADLTDLEAVRQLVAKVRPHLIYHLAGMVTARQDIDLVLPMLYSNLVGTVHVLLAANASDCQRVVVASSAEEPRANDDVPLSPYAAAKFAATVYSRTFSELYDLPVVVARLFMGYGPGQDQDKLIPYVIRCLLAGESPKLSSGNRTCDFIYVLDIVRGLLVLGVRSNVDGHIVELGSGQGTTIREVVDMILELTGSPAKPRFGALPDRVGGQARVADLTATRRLLDWEPVWLLRDGLRETIRWVQQESENVSNTR